MTDPSEVFERLKAARAEVAQSPGALLSDELAGVARSYRLFQANAREFAAFHGRFDTDATARVELWDATNRKLFEAFLGEVDRLLHNYLAAASTLRDHTRRLWRQYPPADPALIAEYDQRVREAFTESPLVQFVQRLRNYSTHSQLPVSRGRLLGRGIRVTSRRLSYRKRSCWSGVDGMPLRGTSWNRRQMRSTYGSW